MVQADNVSKITHAVIASPPAEHLAQIGQLLQQGIKNLLVEKPLASTAELNQAKVIQNHSRSDAVIHLGFNWRLNKRVAALREKLESGELGRVQYVQMYAREWLPNYVGNVLRESGSHILDTARYLLGDLEVTAAQRTNYELLGHTDEAFSAMLRTVAGADVYIHVNFVNQDDYEYRILIQGSKATMVIEPDRFDLMHRRQLKRFLAGDCHGLATLEDGVRNLELMCAAESMTPLMQLEQESEYGVG